MAEEKKESIVTPEAPAILPSDLKSKWKSIYAQSLEQAQSDFPEDVPAQKSFALREANRLLRVPKLGSASDADKLPKWQVLSDKTEKGQRKLVTIDGKKYSFPAGGGAPKNEKPADEKPAA